MYIIEVFIKWLNKNKRGTKSNPNNLYKEGDVAQELDDDMYTCDHKFMPVDSTGTVLACTKCGFVIKHREKDTSE